MGSDWHHRSHLLPEPAPFPTQTLPSVAELLSSSRPPAADSLYHRPADSRPPPPPPPLSERPVSRSASSIVPSLSAPANPPLTADSSWNAVNHHTSPHVSPTDQRLPTTALEHPQYHRQDFRQTALPSTAVSTSEASRTLQDAALAQPPINGQRQDSAISQHRIETFKDAHSFGPPSDVTFASYSTASPNNSHLSPSPTTNSYPTTPSSSLPAAAAVERRQSLIPPQPASRPLERGHSKSLSAGAHVSADSSKSHEHVAGPSAPARSDSIPRNSGPPASSDQPSSTSTRQQRYNVRFTANLTSENMPPSQKARHDAASTAPAPADITEPQPTGQEQPLSASVEPSISSPSMPSANADPAPIEDQSQAQQKRRESSVERCQGCNEPWKRPLPDPDFYRHSSPAENNTDFSRLNMSMLTQLQDHRRRADAMYDRWKWQHSHCLPQTSFNDFHPPSPPSTEPQDDLHTTSSDGASHNSKHLNASSNKRKSEVPHDDVQQVNSKVRKVTFESSTDAPPVRPSSPT
ncbi:hypothetical protein BKA66DRAFT_428641 [Pyrenochaeta sp. MPI-SDFR-AT-0127]|nr:hypothetical protein BKA66DRAFT_428641 [Pyrenochaeta sp. MPI-SDFR-AT-0127]